MNIHQFSARDIEDILFGVGMMVYFICIGIARIKEVGYSDEPEDKSKDSKDRGEYNGAN